MKIHNLILFVWILHLQALEIEVPPYQILATPDSILSHKELYEPLPLAQRKRYATCTGVAWLDDRTLAVLNLYGQHLQLFSFDEQQNTLRLRQKITNNEGMQLAFPENIALSPDRTLMLIANSSPGSIMLYALNPDLTIKPQPLASVPFKGLVHNVRFTPNGAFCACASFNRKQSICMYKMVLIGANVALKQVYSRGTFHSLLRAKAITFAADGAYAIVAYGLTLQDSAQYPMGGIIEVYTFDQTQGALGEKICQVSGPFAYEDLLLIDSQGILLVTDQHNDTIMKYQFDVQTGYLDPAYTLIQNPDARLSFPHGLSVSPDGTFLAVTNYGDDSVNIYRLQLE